MAKKTTTKTTKKKIPTVTLDNKPVSPIVNEEEQNIPKGFVKQVKPTTTTSKINVYNGRVYKILKNGLGMWADNGSVFDLKELR